MNLIGCEHVKYHGRTYLNFWADAFHQGRDMTLSERKQSLESFRLFEQRIKNDPEISGWMTWVKHEYPLVKRIVKKLGGQVLIELKERTWFVKEIA